MSDRDPELSELESIYDALDRDDPEQAWRLARQAIRESAADDPVLHFLAGLSLLELDRPDEAAVEFQRAVDGDPEDAEFRANLALARFRSCEFGPAGEQARRALELDDRLPDAHFALALVLEREDRTAEADARFAKAHQLEPQAFPRPLRLSRPEFEERVRAAADRLPEDFRRHLERVVVTVEELPSLEVLQAEGGRPFDPELLGLFVGVPLGEESSLGPGGELPPRVLLFQRNLERMCDADDRLTDEIARTLYHELGHYLGLDEDELAAIDLD